MFFSLNKRHRFLLLFYVTNVKVTPVKLGLSVPSQISAPLNNQPARKEKNK